MLVSTVVIQTIYLCCSETPGSNCNLEYQKFNRAKMEDPNNAPS